MFKKESLCMTVQRDSLILIMFEDELTGRCFVSGYLKYPVRCYRVRISTAHRGYFSIR